MVSVVDLLTWIRQQTECSIHQMTYSIAYHDDIYVCVCVCDVHDVRPMMAFVILLLLLLLCLY